MDVREIVKKNVLQALGTETTRPSIAAQCINAIAGIEFIYEVSCLMIFIWFTFYSNGWIR